MKKQDKTEIILIGITVAVTACLIPVLPRNLVLGEIALTASGLLLAQGLVRDLWLKYGTKQNSECAISPDSDTGNSDTKCMCMESSLGTIGIIAGVTALLAGSGTRLHLPGYFWILLVTAVLILGFFLKSLVIDWKTKRIRREENHSSIRFGK